MDILFIHGNYPGQFRHLAPLLAKDKSHRVVFMTARENAEEIADSNIKIVKYKIHRDPNSGTHHYLRSTEAAILQGQAVARGIDILIKEGFKPRLTIAHGGVGIGLFIKSILPETIHIGYFEWYFQPKTSKNLIQNFDIDAQLLSGMANLPILRELEQCDTGVVPTQWQKNQFPKESQSKLNIIFDGIDRSFFYPLEDSKNTQRDIEIVGQEEKMTYKIKQTDLVLSYATRGMEPLRGFPEFMRSLPYLFEKHKNLLVIIAGADRRAYSYDAPNESGSWKKYLLKEIESKIPIDRIIFSGLLSYGEYRKLLWRSDLHCYFTHEYVTSWSLFEAAACGSRLAVNRNCATLNIIEDETVNWVTLDNQKQLVLELLKALHEKRLRACLLDKFNLTNSLKEWESLINIQLQNN